MKRIAHLARRATPLLRLASEYTVAHMAARLLAAVSALMLVRLLPVSEYGFYTLVLAAFTFVCTFSDLGATESLSFFRWRAAKRHKPWIPYFHAVVRFRRTVFAFGLVFSAAYVFLTGRHIGATTATIVASIVLLALSAWFAIQSSINAYVLKLEQRFRHAYAVDLSNEVAKLLVVSAIWVVGFATALAGVTSVAMGALVAAILGTRLLEKRLAKGAMPNQRRRRRQSRMLIAQIVPVVPGAIYFAVQGPLIAGLAAYFGSLVNVAEVGALGRLGVLIGVIAGFTGTVFVPRLISITDEVAFFQRYLQWWLAVVSLGALILLIIAAFPAALLVILGEDYAGLNDELLVAAATAVIGAWASYAWAVNRARGWVKHQPWSVPTMIVGQVLLAITLDLSSTDGVLFLGLGTAILGFSYQLVINARGFLASNQK